ncbi:MAG TPA: iron dependent repressor, metal binding and dimerization domain protein [Defluviitaleaceae bacterium]|jgi:DtxR family Mn-dependent transcriptional regulator|nr:DNA-binding protein [Candidatus Epulonipiscium sp.]HPT77208.1 iron dependent repressor, metal binding and dimerization domain protein [Defluviitaleaceae bacterium]HQD50710.1 iron dependent repressor, metal binding and dimerization domain protein [Defluviitaleaceae bacterium]
MLTPSLQDYLEEIYRLSIKSDEIRVSDIAEVLEVSLPSVVKALHKLNSRGYILYQPYEPVKLTEKGIREGKFLVQRNQLLKDFLRVLKTNSDIEKEAESMEHYLSLSTIQAIEKFYHFMKDNPDIQDRYDVYLQKTNENYIFEND